MEGEDEYFSLSFYRDIVYKNWVFDMPKLLDMASVYGKSNPEALRTILTNVFDNDQRYIEDFKDMVGQLVSFNKRALTMADKIIKALEGDTLETISASQVDQFK
jgi:hypothetical protein